MDCKADRKIGVLHVHKLFIESWVKDRESFMTAFEAELTQFIEFNDCNEHSGFAPAN